MESVWTDTTSPRSFPKLNSNIKTGVLVIGGGMAGVLCAYLLDKAGIDYVLAEGRHIGGGITKNTTAKITSQHGLLYNKLIKKAGAEKARMYLEANERAVLKFKELAEKIPCDFEEKDAYIYSHKDRQIVETETAAVNKLGFKAEFVQSLPFQAPFGVAGAVKFKNQAQFNPLKFIYGIADGLNIYENTFIKEFDKNNAAVTDSGRIKAEKIIIATHFPFINKHGGYFLKLYQSRSYVIALENAADVNGMYLDALENGLSFRNYKDLLFIGGGGHKTGKTGGNWRVLREFAKSAYPEASIKYRWATQDCMTLDGIPYIGRYSKATPNLYVAAGFNKWGMTSSMVSAMVLTDMAAGRDNDFAEVFSPQRTMLTPQLFKNGFSAAANLLSLSAKRCPHLGCALKWNKAERTWDCPCHGSRFDAHGGLIDNPATGGIKID